MPDTSARADRELLELAAKAAGLRIADWAGNVPMVLSLDRILAGEWNPLTDDEDAFLLSLKLRIELEYFSDHVVAKWYHGNSYSCTDDTFYEGDAVAAARRAIVRAAAAIGANRE